MFKFIISQSRYRLPRVVHVGHPFCHSTRWLFHIFPSHFSAPSLPYLSWIPYFLFLINWSNLKRTFIGTDHHILPSPCTYIVGAMCPLVGTSDGPRLLTCALGLILSLLQGAAPAISSSYSSISFSIYINLNRHLKCWFPSMYNPIVKQGHAWSHLILWLWPDFSALSYSETPWK